MPRRLILSATERDTLLALPESQDDLIRYYTFNDTDLSLDPPATRRRQPPRLRRAALPAALSRLRAGNRQRAAEPVILCGGRSKLQAEPASWAKYGERDVTRREACPGTAHLPATGPFGLSDFPPWCAKLTELAQQTDKGLCWPVGPGESTAEDDASCPR